MNQNIVIQLSTKAGLFGTTIKALI